VRSGSVTLGDELEDPESTGAASSLVIAIGGTHHDRQIKPVDFDQLKA
jgi:hypothetical protein